MRNQASLTAWVHDLSHPSWFNNSRRLCRLFTCNTEARHLTWCLYANLTTTQAASIRRAGMHIIYLKPSTRMEKQWYRSMNVKLLCNSWIQKTQASSHLNTLLSLRAITIWLLRIEIIRLICCWFFIAYMKQSNKHWIKANHFCRRICYRSTTRTQLQRMISILTNTYQTNSFKYVVLRIQRFTKRHFRNLWFQIS